MKYLLALIVALFATTAMATTFSIPYRTRLLTPGGVTYQIPAGARLVTPGPLAEFPEVPPSGSRIVQYGGTYYEIPFGSRFIFNGPKPPIIVGPQPPIIVVPINPEPPIIVVPGPHPHPGPSPHPALVHRRSRPWSRAPHPARRLSGPFTGSWPSRLLALVRRRAPARTIS